MSETAQVIDLGVERLVHLDHTVDAAEGDGLRARWEFGHELLSRREGKQLPKGVLNEVVKATNKSRQELGYRMRFAERFPTEVELANAIGKFGSWHTLVKRGLGSNDEPAGTDAGPLPEGVYRTLAADPPWQYDNKATRGAAEDHYDTLTISQLVGEDSLPDDKNLVEEVALRTASDAHLYLWTTNGFLREAFDVLDAWGFVYKTCLSWVKPQMGMGNYFRSSTEHVLFGVKGKLRTQDRGLVNHFTAKRGRHSAKPDEFYELVEKASPGPYLELFWRPRTMPLTRSGEWSFWGNE